MKLEELANKHILIAGYGLEGRVTEAFLTRWVPDSSITIVDKKDNSAYLDSQDKYDLVVKSPGIPKRHIHVPYTTATNIFFANTRGTTIGVTGSKGKSTTASLIYAMLKQAGLRVHLVGNIGKPMLAEFIPGDTREDIYVCELSSYQLDDIRYSPHISVFVSLFPEHMDYHGGVDAYFEAKKRIVEFASESDFFIYNRDYQELVRLASCTEAKAVPFVSELPFPDKDIPLLGKHNRDNIRGAVTVAKLFDISTEDIYEAVKHFVPLPHRLQLVGTFSGIRFYDDAISTTPESTMKAIESIPKIGTLFLGGQDRGYDFTKLVDLVETSHISNIVLFPDSGARIESLLQKKHEGAFTIFHTKDMEQAVKFAYAHTEAGYACVLSTASPSYSVWKNFEEKGDLFQKYVKKFGIEGSKT
ncbi:UDP-N-acetylmuramoylalanine--D-glutamate ligase [Candidatus Gottesmanbacteria bacterium RBG_13_45_10]|uniref:UDP-N-acetylmuramoylalanine--D-glutamate ligase n=1 Tax=Candidatus Gottesmanbacteria bacterium RBG_13_45_10 TaxID=1798370 RepID=A0A1F5ZFI7_9BACT|nr:MAG: UDP-N-acetylmuramoylalanine--D-glutamate ligase [Candidatus Gottesmanbacteria bacterium RBG_13_45_10]